VLLRVEREHARLPLGHCGAERVLDRGLEVAAGVVGVEAGQQGRGGGAGDRREVVPLLRRQLASDRAEFGEEPVNDRRDREAGGDESPDLEDRGDLLVGGLLPAVEEQGPGAFELPDLEGRLEHPGVVGVFEGRVDGGAGSGADPFGERPAGERPARGARLADGLGEGRVERRSFRFLPWAAVIASNRTGRAGRRPTGSGSPFPT
jgi:hypothetical protein